MIPVYFGSRESPAFIGKKLGRVQPKKILITRTLSHLGLDEQLHLGAK